MPRRCLSLLLVLGVIALTRFVSASAEKVERKPDVNGTWTWAMQRQNGAGRQVTLTIKQDGEKVTGTISNNFGGDSDIEEGTFKDGEVTFKTTRTRGGMEIVTTYKGKLQGDTIKGKVETEQRGQKVPRDWEATRVKEE
jgi:hypothetical protein